jgi:hypothetical protein
MSLRDTNLKDHPIIVVTTLVITVVGLVVAAAAGAWKAGYDSGESRVKALELSDKLHLTELLADLRKASKQAWNES